MPRDISTGRSNGSRLLLWIERALFLAGAALLVWAGLFLADSWVAQRLAREALRDVPRTSARPPDTDTRPVVLSPGAPIGELTIPSVHLSAVVLNGSDNRTLRRGPGHIEKTALPGQPGNVAIAGHRDTFFRPVRNVQIGDDIYFDTRAGRFHYRVASLDVVRPDDLSVLDPTETPALTLVTCFPFWVAGPAPDRFVVRAYEVDRPETTDALPLETDAATPAPTAASGPAGTAYRPRVERDRSADRAPSPARMNVPADVAVHEAIERFRISYNSRIAKRGDRTAHPLQFASCAIEVLGTTAVATCDEQARPSGEGQRWVFSVQAEGGPWHIVAVEPR